MTVPATASESSQTPTVSSTPSSQPARSPFRTDIQALRAFAVCAVVVNHFWVASLPGGYIGVDVFFVISGFLITRHLMGELNRTGRLRFGQFYARRMRRLLPAALLVSGISLVAAWLVFPFSRWIDIAGETLASAFYAENWVLAAKSIDYSANHDMATTVQHYWSLSVEEQFYLVWPLLLAGAVLVAVRLRKPGINVVAALMSFVLVLSLAFSVVYTISNRNEAYFVTTTRAWEFAAGALVALVTLKLESGNHSFGDSARRLFRVLCWAGAAVLFLCVFLFNETTVFPGAMAAIPVAATGMIILSGSVLGPGTIPGLGWRPVQFLGDVSYSLYLWHWPVLVLALPLLGPDLHLWQKAALVVLSLILAWATKKFIEDPGRTRLFRQRPAWVSLTAGFAAMALIAAGSLSLVWAAGVEKDNQDARLASLSQGPCYGARSMAPEAKCPQRFGPPQAENIGKTEAPWFGVPECKEATPKIEVQGSSYLQDCDFSGGNPTAEKVWLVGDSHAEQWKAAFVAMARERKWHVTQSLLGGCPIVDVTRVAFMDQVVEAASIKQRCLDWSAQLSARILKDKPNRVVVATFASKETIDDGTGRAQLAQYKDAVQRRLGAWAGQGIAITVIRDTPLTLKTMVPDCVVRNKDNPLACSTKRSDAHIPDPMVEAVKALSLPRTGVVDMTDQFCDADRCYAAIGGLFVYFDGNHVARSYVTSMTPLFATRFDAAAGKVGSNH